MTQRAFQNFQTTLKNIDNACNRVELNMMLTNKDILIDGAPGLWFDDKKLRDTQKFFLSIKGEKKNIETDSTLINTKKHFIEKQEYHMLKNKNKKNAINMPLDSTLYKNTSSKKEIEFKETIPRFGKRTLSSHKSTKKPKIRNSSIKTYEANEEGGKRSSGSVTLDRTKSESNNLAKETINDKTSAETKELAGTLKEPSSDKSIDKTAPLVKVYKRPMPQRAATLLISPENEWLKEQEKKVMLRK